MNCILIEFTHWAHWPVLTGLCFIGPYSLGYTHCTHRATLIELCPLSYTRPHSLGHTRVHSLFSPLVQFGPGHIQRLSSAFGRSELKEASLFALLSTRRLGDCAKSSRRRFLEGRATLMLWWCSSVRPMKFIVQSTRNRPARYRRDTREPFRLQPVCAWNLLADCALGCSVCAHSLASSSVSNHFGFRSA